MKETRFALQVTDLFGAKYLGGCRYTNKARAIEQAKYFREHNINHGELTGIIPGYGVAKHVEVVEIGLDPSSDNY